MLALGVTEQTGQSELDKAITWGLHPSWTRSHHMFIWYGSHCCYRVPMWLQTLGQEHSHLRGHAECRGHTEEPSEQRLQRWGRERPIET